MTKLPDGHFFQVPDNIHRAVMNVYELAVLIHLLQRQDGEGCSFPSQETLAQGMMSTKQVNRATTGLAKRGLITIDRKWVWRGGIQLTYTVRMDVILVIVQQTPSPIDSQSSGLSVHQYQTHHHRTDSPSNHTHSLNHTHSSSYTPEKNTPTKKTATDETFFEGLRTDPRYRGLDVRHERVLWEEWCRENKRKATRLRFLRWLDRAVATPTDRGNNGHAPATGATLNDHRQATRKHYTRPEDLRLHRANSHSPTGKKYTDPVAKGLNTPTEDELERMLGEAEEGRGTTGASLNKGNEETKTEVRNAK
jgi:hypothetical protein